MLDNNSLIKYFVRVPSGTSFNGAQVSNANTTNQKKIYFDENTQQIWVKGKSFSLDKAIATAIQTLIGSDTNMSVRAIAGDVVTTALNLTDNADQTINTLKEVLNWFNNLPEGDEGALALVARVGQPAELYTAETAGTYNTANGLQEGDPNYKTAGDVKTPATGLYKVIEDAIGDIDYSSFATKSEVNTKIGSLGNKTEAQAATYYTAEDEEVISGSKQAGDIKTAAVEAVPYASVAEVLSDLNTKINTLSAGGITNVTIGSTNLTVSNNHATITKAALQSELFTNAHVSEPLTYSYLGVTVSVTEQNGELTGLNVDPSGLANRVSVVEEFDPWEEYQAPAEPGE